MINKNDLTTIISSVLKPFNFKRKGSLWYIETTECFSLLELDKSTWGGQFSIMLNTIIKDLSNIEFPNSIYGSFSGWSLDWLVENRVEFNTYLDLEQIIESNKRKQVIEEALLQQGVPFLLKISTIEGLKKVLIENKRLRYHVILKAWDYLQLDVEKEPLLA